MRLLPAEPLPPTSMFRTTFAPPYSATWEVAVDESRLLVRVSAQAILVIGFDEIEAVGKGAYRQPYRPAGGMNLNRYQTGLMLHLKIEPGDLPVSDRLHRDGRRLLLQWIGVHGAVVDYLPLPRVDEWIIDAPAGEFAAEIEPSSITGPLAVIGLGVVMAFAILWTSSDRAAAERAEEQARQRRGTAVIERQGGSGVEWSGLNRSRRRTLCRGFTAVRLARPAHGSYCEDIYDRFVIWDEDR